MDRYVIKQEKQNDQDRTQVLDRTVFTPMFLQLCGIFENFHNKMLGGGSPIILDNFHIHAKDVATSSLTLGTCGGPLTSWTLPSLRTVLPVKKPVFLPNSLSPSLLCSPVLLPQEEGPLPKSLSLPLLGWHMSFNSLNIFSL